MMTQELAPAPVAVRDLTTVPINPRERVTDPKIHPRHLLREALIYVRQSHPNQVQRHPDVGHGRIARHSVRSQGEVHQSFVDALAAADVGADPLAPGLEDLGAIPVVLKRFRIVSGRVGEHLAADVDEGDADGPRAQLGQGRTALGVAPPAQFSLRRPSAVYTTHKNHSTQNRSRGLSRKQSLKLAENDRLVVGVVSATIRG